jgi:hypothetical protein
VSPVIVTYRNVPLLEELEQEGADVFGAEAIGQGTGVERKKT